MSRFEKRVVVITGAGNGGRFLLHPGRIAPSATLKGSIVNVSPVSGLGGDWNMSFYNQNPDA